MFPVSEERERQGKGEREKEKEKEKERERESTRAFYSLTFTFRRGEIFPPFSDRGRRRRCLLLRSSPWASAFASASVPSLTAPRVESVLLFSSRTSFPSGDTSRLIDNNSSNHLSLVQKKKKRKKEIRDLRDTLHGPLNKSSKAARERAS